MSTDCSHRSSKHFQFWQLSSRRSCYSLLTARKCFSFYAADLSFHSLQRRAHWQRQQAWPPDRLLGHRSTNHLAWPIPVHSHRESACQMELLGLHARRAHEGRSETGAAPSYVVKIPPNTTLSSLMDHRGSESKFICPPMGHRMCHSPCSPTL